jgi:hypothetical protein
LPSPGDVFLDLEADIFVGEGGLEYLFGLLVVEDGRPVYREVWAHSLEDEKAGGYESGALKRLMGRHAVREDDLDVRTLRVGVPGPGLAGGSMMIGALSLPRCTAQELE